MKEKQFGVITFKSTHYAIKGDLIFKEHNINYRTIPTPREITRSCGLAIKFDLEDTDLVRDIIEKNQLTVEGIFKLIKDDQGYKAEKLN
ncbi:DUF3343 domain-containing protein [Tepidimicrobium xylanilyticum]|uniref:Putative Se/S carrier protein-like domain-containing protein n=1 Tax=Tepidimicrobium xylanilyticum TaxID=1123352 RepID=A0A1H3CGX2_9FIRM|nr:DUF3343 domain-containing protein [Tepidimicrobium xylanilyticum]GMG98001.1 hypothetical protein EN5CB1_28270 [Tepidimicrobium xylanilyticum]SDX52834.1 Protein of unknown function [Tepidimicrobium xylanilyticum]